MYQHGEGSLSDCSCMTLRDAILMMSINSTKGEALFLLIIRLTERVGCKYPVIGMVVFNRTIEGEHQKFKSLFSRNGFCGASRLMRGKMKESTGMINKKTASMVEGSRRRTFIGRYDAWMCTFELISRNAVSWC